MPEFGVLATRRGWTDIVFSGKLEAEGRPLEFLDFKHTVRKQALRHTEPTVTRHHPVL